MGASNSGPDGKLLDAAKSGALPKAQEAVALGANVEAKDREGNTALSLAVTNGYRLLIDWLINEKQANINTKNADGCTPLMYAASVGHIDILKFLMEKGVLLEEKNEDGFTALHWAAYVGNLDSCKTLVEKGANLKAKNTEDKRPADLAETQEVKKFLKDAIEKKKKIDELKKADQKSSQKASAPGQ